MKQDTTSNEGKSSVYDTIEEDNEWELREFEYCVVISQNDDAPSFRWIKKRLNESRSIHFLSKTNPT